MYYRQLRFGVADSNYKLVPSEESQVHLCLENPNVDIYTSIYKYNESQYQEFLKTKSIKGITDVITNWIVLDFDSKEDIAIAQKDTQTVHQRLVDAGVNPQAIRISFSGNKGFHLEVRLNEHITVDEFKAITRQLCSDLPSFDSAICDHARPFRVLGSINLKSGLFKIPLTLDNLQNFNTVEIQELATDQTIFDQESIQYKTIDLPKALQELKKFKEEEKFETDTSEINWIDKPRDFPACRWSIYNGNFKPGQRHNALMALVSYFRNKGESKETAYHRSLGTLELQAKRNNCPELDKKEFYNTVVKSIYSRDWERGQYSCREKGTWLYLYCKSLGTRKCNHREDENCFIEIDDFATKFKLFAENIEENRLKFGIDVIDEKVMVTTSMLVGLLGAPSAGKTTLLLNFLEQTNKDKIDSVFFSMDMSLPLVYLRLIQKLFGYSKERVFNTFLNDPLETEKIINTVKEQYKYTKFSFRTGLNVEQMREAVQDHQDKIGRKVKLVGIDYLECISGPYSDSNANTGLIANQLKDMSNDLEVCNMLLLQTQKHSGDPSEDLLSMRNIKGASAIEQSCSIVMSLSRPGFSPTNPQDDKFAKISTVKDRIGELMSIDCGWNGVQGSFYKLPDEDRQLLADVKNRKLQEKESKKDNWTGQ